MTRRLEVEFGLKIKDVSPEELAPLLETLSRLARSTGAVVQVTPETQRLLAAHAPPALPPGRPGTPAARAIAALTEAQGVVRQAAKVLGLSETGLYKLCQRHRISPAAFRRGTAGPTP